YQTTCVMYHRLKTRPQCVRRTASSASPNPLGAMKIANVSADAIILHRTQAESASDSNATKMIHNHDAAKIAPISHRFESIHPDSAIADCTANIKTLGIQVMSDSSIASTTILPSTYSRRVNGRLRNSGNALLERSGATSDGPTHAVSSTPNQPWASSQCRKKLLFISSSGRPPVWMRSSSCAVSLFVK